MIHSFFLDRRKKYSYHYKYVEGSYRISCSSLSMVYKNNDFHNTHGEKPLELDIKFEVSCVGSDVSELIGCYLRIIRIDV